MVVLLGMFMVELNEIRMFLLIFDRVVEDIEEALLGKFLQFDLKKYFE